MSDRPSYRDYHRIDLPTESNAESGNNNNQKMLPLFPWFSRNNLASSLRNYNKSTTQSKPDVAPAAAVYSVASISLPAISSSAVEAAVVGRKNQMKVLERISIRDRISPHLVLGKIFV